MAPDYKWGFAGYLERRDSLLRDCPQMVEENRFYHLGLDVIAPLGTQLHAPLDVHMWQMLGIKSVKETTGVSIVMDHLTNF